MSNIADKAREMFARCEMNVLIGYEEGTRTPRPFFAHTAEEAGSLIFDDRCTGNLAVYLTRKDIVGGRKVAIAASYYTLRSIARLYDENQIAEDALTVLVQDGANLKTLRGRKEIGAHLETIAAPAAQDTKLREQINAMSAVERWEFWKGELSKCFKCYACRSACPMCYCTKCIVEENRPQWIAPWAATAANVEWQISRVMHMAGRCSECGACGAACPLGLPVHLLSAKIVELVRENFGEPGSESNVLATFRPEDNESFIL